MNPATVLLEQTFVAALLDPSIPDHEPALAWYRSLLVESAANRRLLAVTDDVRRAFLSAPRGLLDPVETLHVARQERHAAEQVHVDGAADSARDVALDLVLLHRRTIPTVATFDRRYEAFGVELLPGRPATVRRGTIREAWRAGSSPADARRPLPWRLRWRRPGRRGAALCPPMLRPSDLGDGR